MGDEPKYTIEFVEFSEPVADPWMSMDGLVDKLKARGHEPVFATPVGHSDGKSEALVVVGKRQIGTRP